MCWNKAGSRFSEPLTWDFSELTASANWGMVNCIRFPFTFMFSVIIILLFIVKRKDKTIPYRPWGFQEFEVPRISRRSAHEDSKLVRRTHRLPLPPRKYSWYSFLLKAESTPVPYFDQEGYVNDKFEWHHRELNPRPFGLQHSASSNCAKSCPYYLP